VAAVGARTLEASESRKIQASWRRQAAWEERALPPARGKDLLERLKGSKIGYKVARRG
jgi:hypothetical protein